MKTIRQVFITLALIGTASAQVSNPTVLPNGIVNIASFAYAGLPNGDIAPGSMVAIFGTNFGPDKLQQVGSFPLPASLGGSSVKITSGTSTADAIMIYTSASQIAAVIPSSLPAGAATLTVTFNGKTSLPASFKIVPNSFGIFASNQGGSGPGIIANGASQVYVLNNAANPGDTVVIWGTGLGAVAGNEAAGPLPGDITSIPVEIFVGGKKATVAYRGRSGCCVGIDQVSFVVPAVTGCRVPVTLKINNVVSNYTSMPIAPSGTKTCSDPAGPSPADIERFGANGASVGSTLLRRIDTFTPVQFVGHVTSREEYGSARLYKYSAGQLNTSLNPLNSATVGACSVYFFKGSGVLGSYLIGQVEPTVPVSLDEGTSVSVAGGAGTKKLTLLKTNGPPFYYGDLGLDISAAKPGYLEPGTFTVTGTGGTNVGTLQTTVTVPAPLTWTNMNPDTSTVNVDRAAGQLVTWTGGDPDGTVTISGASATNGTANAVGAAFNCTANVNDGQFTVPPEVLLSLPVTGTAPGQVLGALSVATNSAPKAVVATGLDAAFVSATVDARRPVNYR